MNLLLLVSNTQSLTTIFFPDHNPILFLFTRKGNLTPRQCNAQLSITKVSNLRFLHTGGTDTAVADKLSRDFSTIAKKRCQLQHQTLPPHIEVLQRKPIKSLKQVPHLVKHEDVLPTRKMNLVMFSLPFAFKIKVLQLRILHLILFISIWFLLFK